MHVTPRAAPTYLATASRSRGRPAASRYASESNIAEPLFAHCFEAEARPRLRREEIDSRNTGLERAAQLTLENRFAHAVVQLLCSGIADRPSSDNPITFAK